MQAYGYSVFKKPVGVLGRFTVVNPANVSIGKKCGINHDVFILGATRIDIGDFVVLSAGVMLMDTGLAVNEFAHSDFPRHVPGPIVIKDGAWLGAGVIVLPNVTIGRKAVIGAGSVVTKDIPDLSIAVGNPARVIGRVDDEALRRSVARQ